MQLPGLLVGNLDCRQAQPSEDLEIEASLTANVADRAKYEHRDIHATLMKGTRDDEAVAAVVAAAAQNGHMTGQQIAVVGFERGDDLAPGVFHQDDRRNANLLNGARIGLAHLGGIEHAHELRAV